MDVWSKVSEQTHPPRLHGETTHIGTRTPGPYGTPARKPDMPSLCRSPTSETVLPPARVPLSRREGAQRGLAHDGSRTRQRFGSEGRCCLLQSPLGEKGDGTRWARFSHFEGRRFVSEEEELLIFAANLSP